MEKFRPNCNEWIGYKPCDKQKEGATENCDECVYYSPFLGNSLIIEAGGLGSILRTTMVAKEMKEQFPQMRVQWLTHEKGAELLENAPSVDNVIINNGESPFILQAQEYDKIINFESSPLFLALTKILQSREKAGFEINRFGKLGAASQRSEELLRLQTDDYFRKRLNNKSMQQMLIEVAGFEWSEQSYNLITKTRDDEWARQFLYEKGALKGDHPKIIGLNIGSSQKHKAKRWPIENFYFLAKQIQLNHPDWNFVVLAGPEDIDAHEEFVQMQNSKPVPGLIFPGHDNKISQFVSLVNKMPIVVSGDTFGMHAAIGLRKNVISLHGPMPQQEVYLYNKGTKVHLNLECAPCFSSRIDNCINSQRLQCMKEINIEVVKNALENEMSNRNN